MHIEGAQSEQTQQHPTTAAAATREATRGRVDILGIPTLYQSKEEEWAQGVLGHTQVPHVRNCPVPIWIQHKFATSSALDRSMWFAYAAFKERPCGRAEQSTDAADVDRPLRALSVKYAAQVLSSALMVSLTTILTPETPSVSQDSTSISEDIFASSKKVSVLEWETSPRILVFQYKRSCGSETKRVYHFANCSVVQQTCHRWLKAQSSISLQITG
eukprot:4598015-Amphidinium_carterae.1